MRMKAQKYADVQFAIQENGDRELSLSIVWRDGDLYLSLSGLFLNEGGAWYEIPIADLQKVNVINESPLQLRFSVPSLDVVVTGQRAERLLALRHFLLPYIGGKGAMNGVEALLKFWAVGVHDIEILGKLMGKGKEDVGGLVARSREQGLISSDGRVTDKGLSLLRPEERRLIERVR
ncbi:MAG: hypothetical protein AB1665_07455 [Candidatus Thermoplasmatota archaeon]